MTSRHVRRLLVLILGLAVITGVAVVAFGMQLWQTLLLDAIAAAVIGLILLRPRVEETAWWPENVRVDPGQGARREIARLSWTVGGGRGRVVGRLLLLRLREVAARRLERLDLRLDDPADRQAIVERVGPETFRVLDAENRAEVGLAAFASAVRAVESLIIQPNPDQPNQPAREDVA